MDVINIDREAQVGVGGDAAKKERLLIITCVSREKGSQSFSCTPAGRPREKVLHHHSLAQQH
jgi:hypothetical protein